MTKLFLLMFIVSCAHTKNKMIKGPDGSEHQLVSCSEIENCYNKAAEICSTYKIVNTSDETNGSDGKTFSTTHLLVKCDGKVSNK